MKVRLFGSSAEDKAKGWYEINCPACGSHLIAVGTPFENGAQWKFNMDFENPHFNPSIKVTYAGGYKGEKGYCCHFHIHHGIIKFCGDCTHEYKGQHLPLKEIDE